jgi:hypothetical protein
MARINNKPRAAAKLPEYIQQERDKEMKKYIVIETRNNDEWVTVFDTLEETNEYAERAWEHLSDYDKKNQSVEVGIVTENDLADWAVDEETGEIDWTAYTQWNQTKECFDCGKRA